MLFSIADWEAWRPGVLSPDDWARWQSQGLTAESDQLPDFGSIPAMLRRRLSKLGRVAFSLMDSLVASHGPMPIVYASQHGEMARTAAILEDIAAGEPVSPTAFSLSVHNSIVGLFSIHRGIKANITAFAAGAESLVPVLLEANGLLAEGQDKVLCVLSDEPVMARYAQYESCPPIPFVVAFAVTQGEQYTLGRKAAGATTPAAAAGMTPQPLDFVSCLLAADKALCVSHNRCDWVVSRHG